jgi:hypothetical protein
MSTFAGCAPTRMVYDGGSLPNSTNVAQHPEPKRMRIPAQSLLVLSLAVSMFDIGMDVDSLVDFNLQVTVQIYGPDQQRHG